MERIKFSSQQAHRNFRRQVASMASSSKDTTRTLKFPLEAPEQGWPFTFEQAQELFDATEGVGKGSLAGLLFTVLSSGFRAFSSAGNTQLFRSKNHLPINGFCTAFEQVFSIPANQFNPSELIEYFSKEKRSRGNQAIAVQDLAGELYRLARKKLPDKDGKLPNQPFLQACELIADLIAVELRDWKALRGAVPSALKAVDTALASLGHDFPQLQSCTGALKALEPESSSIDYAPGALACRQEPGEGLLPYVALAAQCHGLRVDGEEVSSKTLQARMTTATNNALSWLFGTGLVHWRSTEVEELCRQYGVPEGERWRVERVQQWAKALPNDELYGEPHFAKFRSAVGGKIDSWIANTVKRLQDLESALSTMDPAELALPRLLLDPELAPLFSGQSVSPEQWGFMVEQLAALRTDTQEAAARLLGHRMELPSEADIATYARFSALLDAMHGELELLRNRLNQEREKPNSELTAVIERIKLPKPVWLKAMPKIPGLSGGVPNHLEELNQAGDRFNQLSQAYERQLSRLVEEASWVEIVNGVMQRESQRLQRHSKLNELNLNELALRRLLDHYLQAAKKFPTALQTRVRERLQESGLLKVRLPNGLQEKDLAAFVGRAQRRKCNALLINGQGRVYVSPYSKGRHQAIELNLPVLSQLNLLEWLAADTLLVQMLEAETPEAAYRARLELLMLKGRFLLMMLPEWIDSDRLLPETTKLLPIPPLLAAYLDAPQLPRDQCGRLINLYLSELRGLITVLFRRRFFLRTRFVRVGDNKLFYKPKLNAESCWHWTVPDRLLAGTTDFCQWLQGQSFCAKTLEFTGLKALKDVIGSDWQRSSATGGHLLRQMPHDWCLNLGFDKRFNCHSEEVAMLEKKKLGNPSIQHQVCRLVGSSAFKGQLDRQLVDSRLTHGDYTLIIEQHYKQSITLEAGKLKPCLEKEQLSLEVAVPLTEVSPDVGQFDLSKTYIGIDLGEVGIGYAVVDSQTHELICHGNVRLRSIRNLIRSVRDYRKKRQPNQKFAQRFDTSLMQLRENAVGDVCQAIDALMARYQGIPILESSVRNLAKGSKQLGLVYDKVLNHYVFSDIDAHKSARRHFWYGAENWEHPFAIETIKDRQTDKLTSRLLKLFPGTQVNPAGTSQVCSCCGRNPYELLEFAYQQRKRIKTDSEGMLDLGEAQLRLVRNTLPKVDWQALSQSERDRYHAYQRQCKRRKERPEFRYPLANTELDFEGAKRAVRNQLRRAPASTRSRDTTQSVYVCCFDDCGHKMHADENAAINIVRKWIRDKQIRNADGAVTQTAAQLSLTTEEIEIASHDVAEF